MSRREEILSKTREVPSLPSAAVRVVELLQDSNFNIAEITKTIEYDAGLTSNVLRLANSAYFGCPRTVSSVKDAIVRLGTNSVFPLVVGSAVGPMMNKAVIGYDLSPGELWEHSIAVAGGAKKLATFLGSRPPEFVFTAAMLHDIGKVVLGAFVEVDAGPIIDLAFEQRVAFDEAERRILGIDHAEVGAVLLEAWNLPADLVELIRWHHQPDQYPGEKLLADLLHVADELSIVCGIGAGADGLNYRSSKGVGDRLNLNTKAIEEVACQVFGELDEAKNLFAV